MVFHVNIMCTLLLGIQVFFFYFLFSVIDPLSRSWPSVVSARVVLSGYILCASLSLHLCFLSHTHTLSIWCYLLTGDLCLKGLSMFLLWQSQSSTVLATTCLIPEEALVNSEAHIPICASLSLHLYFLSLTHTHIFYLILLANYEIFVSRSCPCFHSDSLSLQHYRPLHV